MMMLLSPLFTYMLPVAVLLAESSAESVAGDPTGIALLLRQLLAVVVFATVGIVVLAFCFWIMQRLTRFSLVKEIEEDQNVALGIVLGSIAIGISIIIAAAIVG